MSRRGKRRRQRKRPQGFSAPAQRPLWDLMFQLQGVRGRAKRRYFNRLSGTAALAVGVSCAAAGLLRFGFLGAIVGFALGSAITAQWMTKNRYFR